MIQTLSRAIDFARRSIENPNSPWYQSILDAMSGSMSKSGILVTQDSATRLSAFWRGVRLLSETLASVPLCLYERQEPRGRRKAMEHPLFRLLHDEPNPDMTSFFMRECMQAQLVTVGDGYGAIRRDGGGNIRQIWPLRSSQVEPRRTAGRLSYFVTLTDGTREEWGPGDILHVPGISFDGLHGKSVLSAARDVIGSGVAVQDYGATFFRSGGRPPGVVETQMPTINKDNKKNLEETWLSGRGEDWHKVAFLPKGMKYTAAGISPNDSQWLESRKFSVPEIARVLGVPPHLLYDLDRATFSNIEMQSLEFVIYTMRQYFVRWEQELNRKLLLPAERVRYYFEFNADGLMRGDAAARTTFYQAGRQWGYLSANDIRALENQPDIGPGGDVYLTPINMANAQELVDGGGSQPALVARQLLYLMANREASQRQLPPAPASPPQLEDRAARSLRSLRLRRRIRKTQRQQLEDRARVIITREIGAIEKELKAQLEASPRSRRDLPGLRKAIEDFYDEHAGWAGKKMHPIYQAYGELIAGAMADELGLDPEDDPSPELDRFISDYAKRFGVREASEGRLQLLALMEEGDEEAIALAMSTRLGEWKEKRPGKIADIEATRAMAAVAKVLYVAAGVTVLRWVANPGACPFCSAMDGRVAGVQQNFVNAGQGVDGGEGTDGPMKPSDDIGHPPLHDHCECDIVAD
jgi:HK97 family phage portal protein